MADKHTVLLVDDDPAFLKANSLLLRAAGYEVLTAEDGRTGLAAAREHRPDLVVVDVIMSRPDEGFALARAIRGDERLADTRLLVVTAAGQRYQMLFEPDDQWLPVDKVLEKPTSGDELVAEIGKLLAAGSNSGG
ncbi:MAG: response regulator [Candidatus Brocadiia bacterium]